MVGRGGDEAVDAAGEDAEVGDRPEEDEDGVVDEALARLRVQQDRAQEGKEGPESVFSCTSQFLDICINLANIRFHNCFMLVW